MPTILECCALLRWKFFSDATICFRVKEPWAWVECVIYYHQVLRVILFLLVHYLPKINWSGDYKRVAGVNPHPVQVSEIVYSVHVLGFRHVSKKAHSLVKAISAS